MINRFLSEKTSLDIDRHVERIMRGLGNPKPPLDLRDVRELLNLDREYYSANDDGILQETFSRLKVASQQILKRPTLILDAIRKLELKALYIPDQKRILIDKDTPKLKHRWNESHEISHEIIPWHGDMMLGDNEYTLSRGCHDQIENEANYGAGRLLFLGESFVREANDTTPIFQSIFELNKRYGNTITSTLWRYVESSHLDIPMFAVVSDHPNYPKEDFSPILPCRYFIRSSRFASEFCVINEQMIFQNIKSYCGYNKKQMIGVGTIPIANDNGDCYFFQCETFFNSYDALTLGVCKGPVSKSIIF